MTPSGDTECEAFIGGATLKQTIAKPTEADVLAYEDYIKTKEDTEGYEYIQESLDRKYRQLLKLYQSKCEHVPSYGWYYVVFKPFNKTYEKYEDFYNNKQYEATRKSIYKYCKPRVVMGMLEQRATKTHTHFLVQTQTELTNIHDKNTNKHRIYCVRVEEPLEVVPYLIKESGLRPVYEYTDYAVSTAK